jgi:hypothetical protein
MKINRLITPITIALAFACLANNRALAQPACAADFTDLGQGKLNVEIRQRSDGLFDASMNGTISNSGGRVIDETIRSDLNLSADPYGPEFASFNSAERSLIHIDTLLKSITTRRSVRLTFAIADVRRVKTYDLIGKNDKFGGQVLFEAFDTAGLSLGKVVRILVTVSCQ